MKPQPGKIYILRNPAHKNTVVKIGRTIRSSENRAKELSGTTGVPTEFEVLYDEDVLDCVKAEKIVHKLLQDKRINLKREFFDLPLKKAVETVFITCSKVNKKLAGDKIAIFLTKANKNHFERIKSIIVNAKIHGDRRKKAELYFIIDTNSQKRVFLSAGEEFDPVLTPELINTLKAIKGIDVIWASNDIKTLFDFKDEPVSVDWED